MYMFHLTRTIWSVGHSAFDGCLPWIVTEKDRCLVKEIIY